MSYQISQNKGPKKMGHMGMKKPHINTDNTMSVGDTGIGPMTPSTEKLFSKINSPEGDDSNNTMGAPYMFQEDNSLNNYSNKFMENNKIDNTSNDLSQQINTDIIKDANEFSNMNYNINSLQINKNSLNEVDANNNDLLGYDNLFSHFDNYGNDRDISLVNTDMINDFEHRFIKNPINSLQHDIDATGSSASNKINGSNLNNLDSFQTIN